MIFAAGLGKRLRPLTLTTPKPLIPLSAQTNCLRLILQKLSVLGVKRVVINTHYLFQSVHNFLFQNSYPFELFISYEPVLLDTGGGLKNALSFFDERKPILVVNSDIWWQSSTCWFLDLYNHYIPGSILLGLILKERALGYKGKGDYALEDGNHLRRRGGQEEVPYIFSGLRILDASWIKKISQSVFSMTLSFDKAEAEKALYGKVLKGLWSDIGTYESLEGVRNILKSNP